MSVEAQLKPSVGARLRELRRARGLSQKELAQQAGLSLNCVSLLERDEISPNVATLQRLADALGVRISEFFEAGEQTELIRVGQPACGAAPSAFKVALGDACSSLGEQAMQPHVLTLKPHAYAGGYSTQTGHGFVYCLAGRLKCDLSRESFFLEPGEAVLFDGPLPHRCENPGDLETQFVLVVQPPQE